MAKSYDDRTNKAIKDVINTVGGWKGNHRPGSPVRPVHGGDDSYIAQTTSTISAISGSTPGSGAAVIQYFDGTTLSDSTITITVYNITDKSVLNDKFIKVSLVGGYWFFDTAACTSLS